MTLLKKVLGIMAAVALSVSTVSAKKDIVIDSGGKGGNYFAVAQDIVDYCGQDIQSKYGYALINQSTDGSVTNLNALLNKKASIGFIQEDVYAYFKKKDQLGTIDINTRKLFKLYPEYLTILIPTGWHPQATGGFFSKLMAKFSKDNQPVSIQSLKNQTVYAKGGALVSAQALSYFLGLNLNIVDASNHKINGPLIVVTGSGDSRVQKMLASGKWWLLSFNSMELANRASFYKPAKLTYIVKGKSVSANTVTITSIAFMRNYRSKKRKEALKAVKQCIINNIDDLIDDGNSNKWSLIQRTNGWDKTQGGDDE